VSLDSETGRNNMSCDTSKPEVVGLIPARGGSRRILRKNLVDLCGRPLIAYTIEASRRARCITRTIVSTDDHEIADVSRRLGAEVPFLRPGRLATDTARSIDVIRHAARWLENHGIRLRAMVLLQPTSPLRKAAHIDEAVRLFLGGGCDSVVSVRRCDGVMDRDKDGERNRKLLRSIRPGGWLAPWRGKPGGRIDRRLRPCGSERGRQVSVSGMQARSAAGVDLPCLLNGAVYVLGRRVIFGSVPIENRRTKAYIMPANVSVDVDTRKDLHAAERQLSRRGSAR
ncbi:MAG: acylneuraminate cytidylyltransferase family protein, partial [Planctomycetota bacterium]|nr:acylneuraminate cytidylyltransferase family protein [Planctomycetota bacterium]